MALPGLKFERGMRNMLFLQQVFQPLFHLLHTSDIVNDNVCRQRIFGRADSPHMHMMDIGHMTVLPQFFADFIEIYAFRKSVKRQAQTVGKQVPCREQDDDSDDDADDGVDDIPACHRNDDSRNDHAHRNECVCNHVEECTAHVQV